MYSIMQDDKRICYLCQKESNQADHEQTGTDTLEKHFIFGALYSKVSR